MGKFVTWFKEHPVEGGAIIVGVIILLYFMFRSSPASSSGSVVSGGSSVDGTGVLQSQLALQGQQVQANAALGIANSNNSATLGADTLAAQVANNNNIINGNLGALYYGTQDLGITDSTQTAELNSTLSAQVNEASITGQVTMNQQNVTGATDLAQIASNTNLGLASTAATAATTEAQIAAEVSDYAIGAQLNAQNYQSYTQQVLGQQQTQLFEQQNQENQQVIEQLIQHYNTGTANPPG